MLGRIAGLMPPPAANPHPYLCLQHPLTTLFGARSPSQAVAIMALLASLVGKYCLPGVGILCLVVPAQYYFGWRIIKVGAHARGVTWAGGCPWDQRNRVWHPLAGRFLPASRGAQALRSRPGDTTNSRLI